MPVAARRLCRGARDRRRPAGEDPRRHHPTSRPAAMMLKGMTAEYLLRRTFKVKPGDTILFHAAAGGVGLILGQWAKHLGATVIGTAGSADKIALAKAHGFDHVINYREEDFVAEVQRDHRRQDVRRRLRFGRQGYVSRLARLPEAARHVRQLRPVVRADPALQHGAAGAEGLAVRDPADAVLLHRQARGSRESGRGTVRRGREGHRQDQRSTSAMRWPTLPRRMPISKARKTTGTTVLIP